MKELLTFMIFFSGEIKTFSEVTTSRFTPFIMKRLFQTIGIFPLTYTHFDSLCNSVPLQCSYIIYTEAK